jgi:hypothetical protein
MYEDSRMNITTRRWLARASWLLLGVSLVTSVVLGRSVQRLHREQQRLRSLEANTLWFQIKDMAHQLENAQAAMERGDTGQLVEHLHRAEQTASFADRSATLYGVTLTHEQPGRSFGLGLSPYKFLLNGLASGIKERQTISPEDHNALKAIQADISLIQTTFTEDLLSTGSYESIAHAMTTFCQQMQRTELRNSFVDMDAASNAACTNY